MGDNADVALVKAIEKSSTIQNLALQTSPSEFEAKCPQLYGYSNMRPLIAACHMVDEETTRFVTPSWTRFSTTRHARAPVV